MSNVLLDTENFGSANWTNNGSTITAGAYAAPAFAGQSATAASNVEDASAAAVTNILQVVDPVPNDASDWVASVFIRKDAITTAYPALVLSFINGTQINAYIAIDPVNGLLTDVSGQTAADARGVIDVDALWWRVWMRKANNASGNTAARVILYSALSDTFGGGFNSPSLRTLGAWGANLTNTSTVQTYDPNPFYAFGKTFNLVRR